MNTISNLKPSQYCELMQESKVDIGNGIQLHVEIGGMENTQTILLIMGLGAQMLIWPDYFCEALIKQGYRVVRFDNRDIGLSSKIRHKGPRLNQLKLMGRFALGLPNKSTPYTLYDMAEDTSRLMDALHIEKAHVIGASMGGMIAQILAATYPEKVQTLNLLFTSNNRAFLPPPFPKQFLSLMGRPKSTTEDGMVAHSVKLFSTIGSPGHLDIEEAQEFARKLYRRSFHPAGVVQQFLAILGTGSLAKLDHSIKQPTLVVHGSADRLLPPSHGRAVARAIKNARFELVDGMGHDIPKYFVPQLLQLFDQHIQAHVK
ncbi:alpha/beta fold hydrolase [Alkanindiges sp. WGS2144]|uniref:alpha/beta fold hydrolase n=1 Tax=Alkanindiges sp. WGS2144 TaxID=3366808 RepID=UPI0037533562